MCGKFNFSEIESQNRPRLAPLGTVFPHLLNLQDFLKVYNKLGEVKKFRTSRPLFSLWNSCLKKVLAGCAPSTIRVNHFHILISPWHAHIQSKKHSSNKGGKAGSHQIGNWWIGLTYTRKYRFPKKHKFFRFTFYASLMVM